MPHQLGARLSFGGEMEVNEGEISEVKSLAPEPGINGHDKEESGPVGVTFLEKVDPCLLVDQFVVSGWVREKGAGCR
jgi:hypothetical protein